MSENGGAIFINTNENTTKNKKINNELINNDQNYISLDKCTFYNNKANVFGGAIYSTLKNNTFNDTLFKFNDAKILGGALYLYYNEFENIEKANFLHELYNVTYINNTAQSLENKYSSNPSQVILESEYKNIIVKSGSGIPFNFKIVDYFNNIIEDKSRFFYDLTFSIKNHPVNTSIHIEGSHNQFYYGNLF